VYVYRIRDIDWQCGCASTTEYGSEFCPIKYQLASTFEKPGPPTYKSWLRPCALAFQWFLRVCVVLCNVTLTSGISHSLTTRSRLPHSWDEIEMTSRCRHSAINIIVSKHRESRHLYVVPLIREAVVGASKTLCSKNLFVTLTTIYSENQKVFTPFLLLSCISYVNWALRSFVEATAFNTLYSTVPV